MEMRGTYLSRFGVIPRIQAKQDLIVFFSYLLQIAIWSVDIAKKKLVILVWKN